MPWEYVAFEPGSLSGSLLVVGMPSLGAVGPVAGAFLAEHLKMRVVGSLQSEDMPPIGVVRQGAVTSPFQVWATELACGLDGRCDRLLVLRGEAPLEPAAMTPLAGAVARWAAAQRIALVVCLEGYVAERVGSAAEGGGVMAAASRAAAPVLDRLKVTPLGEATLTGFTAALLVRANRENLPVVGLFAPVARETGDAAAAAELLRMVDPLVPNLRLGPGELARRAAAVEARLEEGRAQQTRSAKRLEDQAARGYV